MVPNDHPKSEGGLGVRDLSIIYRAASVKKGSIITKWIQNRYVKGKGYTHHRPYPSIQLLIFFWKLRMGAKENRQMS